MAADLNSPDFSLKFVTIKDQLACPSCYGDLRLNAARLICSKCGREYPIVDGIPILIPDNSQSK